MKRKNIISAILSMVIAVFALQSCTVDNTTFTTYGAFTQPVVTSPVVRADGTVLFTGTTVTLSWTSINQDSNPVSWNVYFGTSDNPPLFKGGLSAQTVTVPVADGVTYYWKVDIVDQNNVKTTSDLQEFTAVNGTNPEMSIDLTCTTDIKTAIGLDKAADAVVDLRLLILKKSDLSIVQAVDDGSANEAYGDFGTLPDGDYVLGVDIFSTINAGDFNKALNLSLTLQFNQLGIINQVLDYPKVMTNANPCSLYRTYLAEVKKAGAKYTISKSVSYLAPSVITWKGTDAGSPSQVKTTESCSGKTMTGLNFGWMWDYWGEIITSGGTLSYTISGNTMTIPLQKYCKTTYKGAAQPEYSIQGTGTIDNSGAYPVWKIRYDLKQGTHWVAAEPDYGGWATPYFEAIITTNPAGK